MVLISPLRMAVTRAMIEPEGGCGDDDVDDDVDDDDEEEEEVMTYWSGKVALNMMTTPAAAVEAAGEDDAACCCWSADAAGGDAEDSDVEDSDCVRVAGSRGLGFEAADATETDGVSDGSDGVTEDEDEE